MKRLVVLSLVCVAAVSCMTPGSNDPDRTTPDAFADYTGWLKVNPETITGDSTGLLGRAHEGASGFREVYVNARGEDASNGSAALPYPQGTVIVKESYADSNGDKGRMSGLTIMAKRESGYDPENGNWEYLQVTPAGKIRAQGRLSGCISCHAAAQNDFVFTDNR